MKSTLWARGSWLALLSFGMQVACAFVICLGQSSPFSFPLSILVSHLSGVSVSLLSVTSSQASGRVAFFLTFLCKFFIKATHEVGDSLVILVCCVHISLCGAFSQVLRTSVGHALRLVFLDFLTWCTILCICLLSQCSSVALEEKAACCSWSWKACDALCFRSMQVAFPYGVSARVKKF